MKREDLKTLGLTDEQIESVMKLNGDDINREKGKFADYDELKNQLKKANATIDGMKDYEEVKASVAKYQQDAEASKKEFEAKLKNLELQTKIKDFTSGKHFVNDLTRDAINAQLEKALNDDANKGKSLDDLLKALTDGKTDIFREENKPTPPTMGSMSNGSGQQPAQPILKASWNRFKG